MVLRSLAVIAVLVMGQLAQAQPFVFDVDGDGLEDALRPVGANGDWAVVSGAPSGTMIAAVPAQAPFSLFGLGVLGAPDINGDGALDVVMLAPAFMAGAEPVGAVHLFDAATGDLHWTSPGITGLYGALGCAVIPDQDDDGSYDLAIRMLDPTCLDRELTLIVAGASGKHLRLVEGPMPKLARAARAENKRLYAATDLNGSNTVDFEDAVEFFNLAAANEMRADVDGDAAITGEDLERVLNDANSEVTVVADEPKFCIGSCTAWTWAEAEQMYSPDLVGPFVVTDVIGTLQTVTPDTVCPSCTVLSEAVYTVEAAASLNFAALGFPGCTDSRPRPGYSPPAPNGCGSGVISRGLAACAPSRWSVFPPCCNDHDNCYATCNMSKAACDVTFYGCMVASCENLWGAFARFMCRQQALAFYSAVASLGDGAYEDGQRAACICCDQPNPDPACTAAP